MTCTTGSCGLGGWGGALPGDPSNDITLSAVGVYGGIQVSWAYPSTNPFAVSYIKVYRGLSAVFSSAMKIAEVSGDRYFDKVLSGTRYYYWIQVTSINGTVAGTIGPASAIAQAAIDEIYTLLSGMIDSSLLTTSLRTNIDKIGVLGTSLQAEVDARLADNTSLGTVLAASELEMAAIRSQLISDRATNAANNSTLANADTAEAALRVLLTARVDTAESGLSAAQSDILTEAVTRASDDSTNASNITALSSQVNNVTTGLPTTRSDMLSAQTTQAGINSALASDTRTLKVQTAGVDADILSALLSGEATRVALDISVALARQELQTQMTVGILAEASARLTLAAVVGTNAAILTNEQLVRATND